MGSITRLWRHYWHDERAARRLLDEAALDRLQQRVQASERRHTGEVRVCIEASLPLDQAWRGTTPRQRAVELFGSLRVWDTEHDNGVLIYLLLAEHAVEVVADRGLHRKVPQGEWEGVVAGLANAFVAHRYEDGLMEAVDRVEALLVRHFPLPHGTPRPNELEDRPVRL